MNVSDFPLYRYRATVRKIVDGDTAEVLMSMGDRLYCVRRIRILGFDAPELIGVTHEAGVAAQDALALIIPVGCMVYIETKLDRTNFNRLLGTVYVEGSDGELFDVAESMITGGFIA